MTLVHSNNPSNSAAMTGVDFSGGQSVLVGSRNWTVHSPVEVLMQGHRTNSTIGTAGRLRLDTDDRIGLGVDER